MSCGRQARAAFTARRAVGGATFAGGAALPRRPRHTTGGGPQPVRLVGATLDGRSVRMTIANGRARLTFVTDPDGGVALAESAGGLHPVAVERMTVLAAWEVAAAQGTAETPPLPRGSDRERCESARRTLRLGLEVAA